MRQVRLFGLAIMGMCALSGCSLVHELKDDPAIVGITGFNLVIGIDPAINSPFPAPKVHMNWGAAFRIGPHDCVYVSTAGGASAYTNAAGKPDSSGEGKKEDAPATQAAKEAVKDAVAADETLKQKEAVLASDPGNQTKKDDVAKAKESAEKKHFVANTMLASTNAPSNNSCVPTTNFSTSAGGETGSGGQAHLTISANGLDTLKERWRLQARLDEVLNSFSEGTFKEIAGDTTKTTNFTSLLNALHAVADDKEHTAIPSNKAAIQPSK